MSVLFPRSSRTVRPFLLFVLLALQATAARAVDRITYEVTPDVPGKQYNVVLIVPKVQGTSLRVQIPTWAPGAYIIGNYAANIAGVEAKDDKGASLVVSHPDKLTWEVATNGVKEVMITYRVTNADLQEADGKPKRGHITGPRTYLYVVDRKTEPVRLSLAAPSEWKIATSLDPDTSGSRGGGGAQSVSVPTFSAPNYDVLADAPVEMGDYAEDNFEVKGVPHKVVLYGNYATVDRAKLTDFCKRVAETETAFFNDIPFKRYIFMFRSAGAAGGGAGGLEHLGSTEIFLRGQVDDRVRSVIAHEYFHLWNVKRIRPFVLGPFDYTGPVRTKNLWWSEGVTSYYGDLLSRRGKINTDDEYLKHIASTIGQLQSTAARLKVTADDSSYKVWDGGGSQGAQGLSYYTKGELIGLCLDLKIRDLTKNRRSLDDVIKALYAQCGKGKGPGFGEDDIKATVNRISGQDLSAFYDRLARSLEEMPFEECLGYAGLKLDANGMVTSPSLGMNPFPNDQGGIRLGRITEEGAAAKAGLKTGDILVAVDGKPVKTFADMSALTEAKGGASFTLTIERDGQKQDVSYTVGSITRKQWTITPDPSATPAQIHLREKWLNG